MKFLKTALVLLFSFSLIGSQTVFGATAVLDGAFPGKATKGCGCSMKECCMQQASKAPAQPLASIPVSSHSHTQHFIAAVCAILLQQPLLVPQRVAGSAYSSPSAPAVALFTRHCSFLI